MLTLRDRIVVTLCSTTLYGLVIFLFGDQGFVGLTDLLRIVKVILTIGESADHEFHEICHSVTSHCIGQFTPKMKANAEPRLLSSLV